MRILTILDRIDRRIVYLLLAVVVFVPLKWTIFSLPLPITPEVQSAYDTIQNMPKGKIAWISVVWGPGTQAENRTQMEVLVRHLFMKGVPFILMPWDQQGTKVAEKQVEDLAKELHKKEGVDWISIGYRPGYLMNIIKGSIINMNKTLGTDRHGTPLYEIPMTKGKTISNVGLLIETTPSGTLNDWISYLGQPLQVPIIYCPTAVMVPDGYNYVDTKQVAGMLPGLTGAAQYDELLHHTGFAQRGADALSMAHALVIALIIVGNVGYVLTRRQRGSA